MIVLHTGFLNQARYVLKTKLIHIENVQSK